MARVDIAADKMVSFTSKKLYLTDNMYLAAKHFLVSCNGKVCQLLYPRKSEMMKANISDSDHPMLGEND